MFGFLEDIAKAAIGVVTLPIDVAADIVTLGGSLTDEAQPYTVQKVGHIMDNITNAVTPEE